MRGKQLRLTDFSGGYNGRDDIVDLPLEQSANAHNLQPVGEGGGVVQRAGDEEVTDWSSLTLSSGDYPLFASRSLGRVLIPAGATLVEKAITGGAPTLLEAGGGGSLGLFAFIEAPVSGGQGPIYYIKSSNPRVAKYWTGSGAVGTWTAATGTLPATARHLLYAGNRVWAASTAAEPSAIYWSEIGDPRNWPAANVVKFSPEDGEEIAAIGTVAGNIVVFKQTKAFLIYDLDTGANRPLGFGIGSDIEDSIVQETPLGLLFTSRRGLQVTDGFSASPIADVLGISTESGITGVAYFDGSVFVAIGGTEFYEFDLLRKSWWRHNVTTGKLIQGLVVTPLGSSPRLYASGRDSSLDRLFVPSDYTKASGSAMAPQWTTPYMAMGSERQKRFRALEFRGKGTMTFVGTKDYDVAPVTNIFSRGPFTVADSERLELPTLGVGRSLQVRITGSGTTAADALRMDELVLHAQGRRD